MSRWFGWGFGWAHAVCFLPLIFAPAASAKPKSSKSKPAPTTPAPPTPDSDSAKKPEAPRIRPRVEIGACPAESLSEMEAGALVTFLRKRCRNLKVPEGAAPTVIGDDESLVAICVQPGGVDSSETEAIEPKDCDLKAAVEIEGGAPHPLIADGELALVLRTSRLGNLGHGARFAMVVSASPTNPAETERKTIRSPLVFERAVEGYGPAWIWIPVPMFTTDFSSSAKGYRFGITPIAVAVGTKLHPGPSRGYFGISAFVGWNILIPNDTQTLSNGTSVRINYKAIGTGVLFDASGWVGVGLGLGHTFTTDSRTDFRTWFYLGPRLLFGLNEW